MIDMVERFSNWLDRARKGDQHVYFCGNLATACLMDRPSAENFRAIRKRVWSAYEFGHVTLVQRRYGVDDFEYIAQRL